MFDFGNANEAQKLAITTTDGPVLITAGPGTGKTYTLVQRAIYLIEEKNVRPEEILMATFTEKAAKEIITRITNELLNRGIEVNVNEMYIGTFHSLCLRFLKEQLEYTNIKKNFRTLDDFDQKYVVFQNINTFRKIENYNSLFNKGGAWKQAEDLCKYVNALSEEMVSSEDLSEDDDLSISALGGVLETYNTILKTNNMLDFSHIQIEAYELLKNHKVVLSEIQTKIKYLMIDEYQDTNYIQEQIVFMLAGENNNICVVGDDDQGLYRFRGATIRNILEFPKKFEDDECEIISLDVNYRSNSQIVDFYNEWISVTSGRKFKFAWDKYRFDKRIVAHNQEQIDSTAVIKVASQDDVDEWHENILEFINYLIKSNKISNLNQIAFLFRSVKSDKVLNLAKYLEENSINVYSPRSNMFFDRLEIKMAIGTLLLCFPKYVLQLEKRNFAFVDNNLCNYYEDCIKILTTEFNKVESKQLRAWLRECGRIHSDLKRNTDYAFSGLLYQMFQFYPFADILEQDLGDSVVDVRPLRNLSKLSEILVRYEYLHRIDILSRDKIDKSVDLLFNMYFRFLFNGGIGEYEDDSEYAPSGCVSFLTIHQSKGLEFPIVVVGSLSGTPRNNNHSIIDEISEKYFQRPSYEPEDQIKFFDFWRLYYTAFSRAQNLLVLTANETTREPSKYFSECYTNLHDFRDEEFNVEAFDFAEVKDVNLKETYSFTSHISVYENCSLQYKFFKELGFTPLRVGSTLFGQLVHQTIEDIHKAALRKEEHLITNDNIESWLSTNYSTLSKSEHSYLGEPQIKAALGQVLRYAEKQDGNWSHIQEAEVEVNLLKPDYIIEGKVDLIRGEGDSIEIVDFKSEKKPDIFKEADKIEHYKKQLQVYAYLVEKKTGQTVSKLHLYYTGEEGSNPQITFPSKKESIDSTIEEFDGIVRKIKNKDFCKKSKSQIICNNCDFRYHCSK